MQSYGSALIQYNWCPCKNRKFGHGFVYTKDDHVETLEEDSHLQVKEREGLKENNPTNLFLGLPASRTLRK